jgi:Phytanoyl-CoA dioxygenase (PhyH)
VNALTLTSNGEPVPFDEGHFAPMRDSTGLLADADALRERFRRDGYLLIRGLLDRARILWLREQYFSRMPAGFLRPGTAAVHGIFSGRVPTGTRAHGVAGHPAYDFVRSGEFQQLGDDPALRSLAGTLLGGPVRPLPRQIVRHFYLGSLRASRAHTDFEYMKGGSDRLVTTWIPLGDCPLAMGGLIYLDAAGPLPADQQARLRTVHDREQDPRPLSHDLGWTARVTGRRWLWTDYSAGDITVHAPHIVHASLDVTTDAMRLSADLRFQLPGAAVDPGWTRQWAGDDGA